MGKIPKIIHFCWMSGEDYPELIKKCISSWKEKLLDYEIKLWNADNFNVNICSLLDNEGQYKKIAENGKETAKAYDYSYIAERYSAVIKHTISFL